MGSRTSSSVVSLSVSFLAAEAAGETPPNDAPAGAVRPAPHHTVANAGPVENAAAWEHKRHMELLDKLRVLADAAKYDASCASSGTEKRSSAGRAAGVGSTEGMGICHAYAPDGRCISLLKILLTNACVYDCLYCINRRSSDTPRVRFTMDEVVTLTLGFYRRNCIEGLFLSSGIIRRTPTTRWSRWWRSRARLREDARLSRLHPSEDDSRTPTRRCWPRRANTRTGCRSTSSCRARAVYGHARAREGRRQHPALDGTDAGADRRGDAMRLQRTPTRAAAPNASRRPGRARR